MAHEHSVLSESQLQETDCDRSYCVHIFNMEINTEGNHRFIVNNKLSVEICDVSN